MASETPPVPRRWREVARSATDTSAGLSGSLADHSLADVIQSAECVVLLGPPGSGKSTDLRQASLFLPGVVDVIHLGGITSQDRLSRLLTDSPAGQAIKNDEEQQQATLALDSLDELPLTMPAFASIVDHELRPLIEGGLRIVVACRTAAWHPVVESALAKTFGKIRVFELEPFNKLEVRQLVDSRGADPATFDRAVSQAHCEALLGQPITLNLLIDEYLRARPNHQTKLSATLEELYLRSCESLIREPNPNRIDLDQVDQALGSLPVAGHMAAVSLFSGRQTFQVLVQSFFDTEDAADQVRVNDVAPSQFIERISPISAQVRDLDRQTVSDTLACALFRGEAAHRVRWQHQALQEFLAARYLVSIDSARRVVSDLFRTEENRLPAQLQAVAAWLIALDERSYGPLLETDPEAFLQTGFELSDSKYRKLLVDSLLKLAARQEVQEVISRFDGDLRYPELAMTLGSTMKSPAANIDQKHLAISIARGNKISECLQTLVDLAMDATAPVHLRNSAGHAVIDYGDSSHVNQLLPLMDIPPAADPDDELHGLGLSAYLTTDAPLSNVIARLRVVQNPDLFGSYQGLLRVDLPQAIRERTLSCDEISALIGWALRDDIEASADISGVFGGSDQLADEILCRAISVIQQCPALAPGIARLIIVNSGVSNRIFRDRRSRLPETGRQDRQRVFRAVALEISEDGSDDVVAFDCARSGLLDSDDFEWLVSEAFNGEGGDPRKQFFLMGTRAVFNTSRQDHIAVATPYSSDATIASLLTPPTEFIVDEDEDNEQGPTVSEIVGEIDRAINGAPTSQRLTVVIHYLHFRPGQVRMVDDFALDITKLPGWDLLSASQHEQIYELAAWHVRCAEIDRLKNTSGGVIDRAELDGVRALILLGDRTPTLQPSRWADWLYVVSIAPSQPESHDALADLTRRIYESSSDEAIAVLDAVVRAQKEFGQFTLRRLTGVSGSRGIEGWLANLVRSEPVHEQTASAGLALLMRLDVESGVTTLGDVLSKDVDGDRAVTLTATALGIAPGSVWPLIESWPHTDDEDLRNILLRAADRESIPLRAMSEDQCGKLWEMMIALFPPSDDPFVPGAHIVSPRESAGRLRDRILPHIADLGTAGAVSVLETLSNTSSESYVERFLAKARQARRSSDWKPMSPRSVSSTLASLIASAQSRTRLTFWNQVFSVSATVVALGSAAVVGSVPSAPAGLVLGIWLLSLAAAIALIIFGRKVRNYGQAKTLARVPLPWQMLTGSILVVVLLLLVPIVITVLLR